MKTKPDVLLAAGAELAECPVWDARAGVIRWVDAPNELVHRTTLTGATESAAVGTFASALALRHSGGLVLAVPQGFATWQPGQPHPNPIATVAHADPSMQMNDGACDSAGRFWACSVARGTVSRGLLYRLDPNGSVSVHHRGWRMGNGIGWSPSGKTMYVVDSRCRTVDAFVFDPELGQLGSRRRFVDVHEGQPDGLAVDCDGHVWIAIWGAGQVHRYASDGKLREITHLPTPNISSCAFCGHDLQTLVITSAREGLNTSARDRDRLAGGLFIRSVETPGLPVSAFGG